MSRETSIYLDHNATTPMDPRVATAMATWLHEHHGNPSSIHGFGQRAREAVEEARAQVAALVDAEPPEIVFCGSGTEANNGVLRGLFEVGGVRADEVAHLVISAIEHPSIEEQARLLESRGVAVTRVAPSSDGRVRAADVLAQLRADTRLVAVMLANNELGTVQPVTEIADGCRAAGVPVLCDAVQAIGKIPVSVRALGVDYLTIAAHKFHGPLGAAALWVHPRRELEALLVGGSQERRRRASTENVPALVGFGRAAEIARLELGERAARLDRLRARFERAVLEVEGARIHCADAPRLPNTSSVGLDGVDAHALTIRLDLAGFAVSTGAACASGTVEPSRTLLALGLDPDEALSTLRVSVGLTNSDEEIDRFVDGLVREVATLRGSSRNAFVASRA